MSQRFVDEAAMSSLVGLAAYGLPDERQEMVRVQYNALLEGFDAFGAFEIKEVPPAHSFNPRWEE